MPALADVGTRLDSGNHLCQLHAFECYRFPEALNTLRREASHVTTFATKMCDHASTLYKKATYANFVPFYVLMWLVLGASTLVPFRSKRQLSGELTGS